MNEIKLPPLPNDSETPASSEWQWSDADMQAYAIAAIEADRQARGEPVDVPDALRQIAGWMDDGGPSKHEAEMICMSLSGPVECSSHHACAKGAKLAFLEAARIWERAHPPAPQPPQIPEGYKLVPIEPTDEMIEAADRTFIGIGHIATGKYKAMLEAAPEVKGK